MIEELVSELEKMIRELEASGIDTGIDIDRLKEITLSIKNGSGYATMSELQAEIGKVQKEITGLRGEVGELRTKVDKVDNTLHTEIAAVRKEVNKVDNTLHKEIAGVHKEITGVHTKIAEVHKEIGGVRADLERGLREQTTRFITIVSVMLGIIVAALSIVATVIGFFS